jgi:hypothetical protein
MQTPMAGRTAEVVMMMKMTNPENTSFKQFMS